MRTMLMLMALVSASAVQADDWQDYKCYLTDRDGEAWIKLFEMQPQNRHKQQASLVGAPMLDSFGQPTGYIKAVMECVGVRDTFTDHHARLLDEQTPK
ncbi:TapY2 family type IVa secretion system protein [Ferrimonas balearica]|uniref:TapY2 family type IVa secretion system protein n=1 Tax=Ferrimonas balearica TaxID=44012 RepID=UPI001C96C8FE|nr:TapY2 family type IVa secretion system protein [Ferrimonas balearica]MBY6225870.1 TapY2 family type IVa secretion system protein [Ferrimonas balearica]